LPVLVGEAVKTLPQAVVVLLLLGGVAGCGNAELSPPATPGRAEQPPRESQRLPVPAVDRRLAGLPGVALEAELAPGEIHSYRIDLAAGQYAALTVEQRGVDVALLLRAPGGRQLRRVDSLTGERGPEPLPFIAEKAGAYRVEVRSLDAGARGPYTLGLEALRSPTPGDRSLVAAEGTFAAGEELRRKGGQVSLRQAVEHHRRALDLFRSSGASDREADVLLSLGSAFSDLGEYGRAREAYERTLRLYRAAGRSRELLRALGGLGRAHRLLGEPESALRCYREVLSLSRELGERRNEIETLGNLGKAHAALGEFEDALAFYEQALAGWRELGVPTEEAFALNNLGQLYLELGEVRQAIDLSEEALAILEAAGEARRTGTVLASLGAAYGTLGELTKGIEYLQRALRLHRRAGNRRDEAAALNDLGLAHRQAGALTEARRYYREALDIDRVLGDRSGEATALLNLGRVYDALGDPGSAVRFYHQALSGFAAAGDRRREAATLFGLALALRHGGDLEGARAAVEAALVHIESLRAEPTASELRASYYASKQQYLAFHIDLLMDLHELHPDDGYAAKAFEVSERARARSLLEELAGAERRLSQGKLVEEEADLARRLNTLETRRLALSAAGVPSKRLRVVESELRWVVARHRRIRAALRGGSAPRSTANQAGPLRLKVIQRRVLDAETLLLEYYLGEERSFLWAVTSASMESFELPRRATIEAAARRALELLPESHRRTARARAEIALQDLSRLLLAPVGDRLAGRRLLVVADGVLQYIPFAALPVARGASNELVPLIIEHEVVSLPSASTAAVLRNRHSARPSATVAVLADPVFAPGDPRLEGLRPSVPAATASTAAYRADAHGPAGDLPPGGFPRLPYSRQEAKNILALVPASQGLALLDFDASREEALSGALSRYRYIHFATHGILDTAYPELSGLVLSLVDRHGLPEGGFLRAHEIVDMRLAADLVVLSACRTALGKEIRGEGLVGLTQAFLDAGANGVMVSLWQVEDRATAELMRRLYEGMLREGLPPAAALRGAQVSLWREGDWRAPYYWAGFAIQGDWQ
jgi:CHAT domain-containing protein/Flp pilus assembly protein TadD